MSYSMFLYAAYASSYCLLYICIFYQSKLKLKLNKGSLFAMTLAAWNFYIHLRVKTSSWEYNSLS